MDRIKETAVKNIREFTTTPVGRTDPLRGSKELVESNPELVSKIFYGYYRIIKDLFELSSEDLQLITKVNEKLEKRRGANEFVEVMGKYKEDILAILRQAGDIDLEGNKKGLGKLAEMMENAWNIKKEEPNWTPKDGDPRSDNVIWGFVKGANTPLIDVHFTVCHGIERILTENLKDKVDEDYIKQKDWLLVGMNDVVALRGLKGGGYESEVIDLWSTERPNGLGWISSRRKTSYEERVKSSENIT